MEPNKILSATILDLVFDGRNKDYGAYELRASYTGRVKKSLVFVFIIAAIGIEGVALGSSFKLRNNGNDDKTVVVTIQELPPDDKPIPDPEKPKPQPRQAKTVKVAIPKIVETSNEPPPTQDDIKESAIDIKTQPGDIATDIVKTPGDMDSNKGIIQPKDGPDIVGEFDIEVAAKYDGDWIKFLTRNLKAETPVEHGAPAGRYTILIQFVVDQQGNLSDIKAVTNFGFGMEDEAIRVLKKAKGWKPGIQNGHEVKSYHKQPITFVVEEQ